MNFTNSPFERMMRQRPGTDSDHPCISCRHRRECGYMMHQCRKKFRSVFDTAPRYQAQSVSDAVWIKL